MSEIKFACPACGQHLACEPNYAGRLIPCPSCQVTITVPDETNAAPVPSAMMSSAAPAPLVSVAGSTSIPAAPPPPPPPPRPPGPRSLKTSGLAVASLACSCAGLFFGFLATIPGIILGFKALRQIKGNPAIGGKGLATAGLVTGGVLTLLWIPLAFILGMGIVGGVRAVKAMKTAPNRIQISETRNADVTADLTADPAGWMPELDGVAIPDIPVAGRLGGYNFTPGEVDLNGPPQRNLVFSSERMTPQGMEVFRLAVEFDQSDTAIFSGRTITVSKEGAVAVQPPAGWVGKEAPQFDLLWTEPGTGPSGARMRGTSPQPFPCAMRLEFGPIQDDKIPGRIYLCVLDQKKSFLRGKFVAAVNRGAGVPMGFAGASRPGEPPADTSPDAAGWTLDLNTCNIPDVTATGRVHGVAFKADRVSFEGPMLRLRQGLGFFADREFEILLWDAAGDPAKFAKRTIEVLPGDTGQKPGASVSWMERGGGVPESFHANTYAMKLEFGEVKNGRLEGRVYLCLGDREKSFVRGKFLASLQQPIMVPAPAPMPRPNIPPPPPPPNFPTQRRR